jgi:hypothetical protein
VTSPKLGIPRLVCFPGRTQEAVEHALKAAAKSDNPHLHSLMTDLADMPSSLFPFRGYTVLGRADGQEPWREVQVRPACVVGCRDDDVRVCRRWRAGARSGRCGSSTRASGPSGAGWDGT